MKDYYHNTTSVIIIILICNILFCVSYFGMHIMTNILDGVLRNNNEHIRLYKDQVLSKYLDILRNQVKDIHYRKNQYASYLEETYEYFTSLNYTDVLIRDSSSNLIYKHSYDEICETSLNTNNSDTIKGSSLINYLKIKFFSYITKQNTNIQVCVFPIIRNIRSRAIDSYLSPSLIVVKSNIVIDSNHIFNIHTAQDRSQVICQVFYILLVFVFSDLLLIAIIIVLVVSLSRFNNISLLKIATYKRAAINFKNQSRIGFLEQNRYFGYLILEIRAFISRIGAINTIQHQGNDLHRIAGFNAKWSLLLTDNICSVAYMDLRKAILLEVYLVFVLESAIYKVTEILEHRNISLVKLYTEKYIIIKTNPDLLKNAFVTVFLCLVKRLANGSNMTIKISSSSSSIDVDFSCVIQESGGSIEERVDVYLLALEKMVSKIGCEYTMLKQANLRCLVKLKLKKNL